MTGLHILAELFFVGIGVLGVVVFLDTIKQALRDDDEC